MDCKFCKYKWQPRVTNPKSCPRCKYRFDYPSKVIDVREMLNEVERGVAR